VASILNILDGKLKYSVGDYISSLQTYEGGIGPQPYNEAHGGQTFCAIGALCIIEELEKINL
jgi:protein farnesyltransferase subunit beta